MQIIYWAHSYREEDAALNHHFGLLIEGSEQMIVNFDPPSESVNESKLQQNLSSCDGMVAILTWRPNGPSKYILFEIALALRSRKPLLVFVDDRLPSNVLPHRILQQRYCHTTYIRQIRDQVQALGQLKAAMGDPPPTRYQPSNSQQSCGVVGLSALDTGRRTELLRLIEARHYQTICLEETSLQNPLIYDQFEHLASLKVVVSCEDSLEESAIHWAGAISAASLPAIKFTIDPAFQFDPSFPKEFQPRQLDLAGFTALGEMIEGEFALLEQSFLKAEDDGTIDRYVKSVIAAGLSGRYQEGTRNHFIEVIMGHQYNVQGNNIVTNAGRDANVHDISLTQTWGELEGRVDLAKLAEELEKLRIAMEQRAKGPEDYVAAGNVAQARASALANDGPKVIEHLKAAKKWAMPLVAEVGVALVAEIFRTKIMP
jgi:hypothetical protein